VDEAAQLGLFGEERGLETERQRRLDHVADEIRERFGDRVLRRGRPAR
jgi:hypothetical protein